jgi:hypothetical protein
MAFFHSNKPLARRRQAPQHYSLMPPSLRTPLFPRHAHQQLLDSPGLLVTWVITSPIYICSSLQRHMSLCYLCADTVPVLFHVCYLFNIDIPYPLLYSSVIFTVNTTVFRTTVRKNTTVNTTVYCPHRRTLYK